MSGRSKADPSGVTPRKGASGPIFAPEYRMTRPSGDHTGLSAGPSTSRTGSPPPTGILNNPGFVLAIPSATIHLPSGDQLAAPRTSSPSARDRLSAPSAEST